MKTIYHIIDDKVYSGKYEESNNLITVNTDEATKTKQLNSKKANGTELLAYTLLMDLIREGHAAPKKYTKLPSSKHKHKHILQLTEIQNGIEVDIFLVVIYGNVVEVFTDVGKALSFLASKSKELEDSENTPP